MAENNDLPGKRKLPRLSVTIPLKYSVSDNVQFYIDEEEIVKGTKDFSILGMCISTHKEFIKDTLLELELKFPDVKVKAMGKVAWSRYVNDEEDYNTGVKFIAIENKYLDILVDYYIDKVDWKSKEGKTFLKKILLDIYFRNIM